MIAFAYFPEFIVTARREGEYGVFRDVFQLRPP